jgi:hypothetical protein
LLLKPRIGCGELGKFLESLASYNIIVDKSINALYNGKNNCYGRKKRF